MSFISPKGANAVCILYNHTATKQPALTAAESAITLALRAPVACGSATSSKLQLPFAERVLNTYNRSIATSWGLEQRLF